MNKNLFIQVLLLLTFWAVGAQAQRGMYREPGAILGRRPYTTFFHANRSNAELERQIEAVRQQIMVDSFSRTVYQVLYNDANTLNPAIDGHPAAGMSAAPAVAKNAAFVYLLGFDINGNDLTAATLNSFRDKAFGILNQLNSESDIDFHEKLIGWGDFQADRLQWRSKELLMYAQAYDLLAAGNIRHGAGLNFQPMEVRLQDFAKRIYKHGEFHLERGTNHSLMIAAALGTAAIVLNHESSKWYKPAYHPMSWANVAHYNFDKALWTKLSGKGGIEGYAEGPYYFNFAFENAAPFFRAMGNYLPENTVRQYSNNRFAIKRIYISLFGVDLIDWTIGPRRGVSNYSYDKSFLHLYDWASGITQPDGLMPTLDDSWGGKSFDPIMSLNIHEDTALFLKERYAFNIPRNFQDVDLRADWLASLNPPTPRKGESCKLMPISGNMVLQTPYERDGTDSAYYLHLSAETGKAGTMDGHEHNDAGSISLKVGGNDLIFDPAYRSYKETTTGEKLRNAHSRVTNNTELPLGVGLVNASGWDALASLGLPFGAGFYYAVAKVLKETADAEYKEAVTFQGSIAGQTFSWTQVRSDQVQLKNRFFQMQSKTTGSCRGIEERYSRRIDFMRQRGRYHYVMHDLFDSDVLGNVFQWRLNGNGIDTAGTFVDSTANLRYAQWTGNVNAAPTIIDRWDLHVSIGTAGGSTQFSTSNNLCGRANASTVPAHYTQLIASSTNSAASGFLSVLWPFRVGTLPPNIVTTETADHALISVRNFDLTDSLSNAYVASRVSKTTNILNPLGIGGDSTRLIMVADYGMISMAGMNNVTFGQCVVNTKFRMAGIENGKLLVYGDTIINSNRNIDFSFEMSDKLLFEGYVEVDTFSMIRVRLPDFLQGEEMRAYQKGTKRSLSKWYNSSTGEMIMELYPGYYEFEIKLIDPCLISCFFPNPIIQNHFVFKSGITAHLGHDLNIIPNLSEPENGKLSILKGSKMSICPDYGLVNQKNIYMEGEYDPLGPGGPGKQLPLWTEYDLESASGGEPELPGDRIERDDTTTAGSVKKMREISRRSMIIVRHGAALVLDSGSHTVVGPHSTILVRKGATLLIRDGAVLEIVSKKNGGFGEVIVEDSAYVCASPGAVVRFVGDSTDTHRDRNVFFMAMMDSSRAQGSGINAKPAVNGINSAGPAHRLALAGKIYDSLNICYPFCDWKTLPSPYGKVANPEYGWSNLNTPKARFILPDTICYPRDLFFQARHTLNEADYQIRINGVVYDTIALYHTIENRMLPELFTPLVNFVPDSSYLVELWVRNDCGQRDSVQKLIYYSPLPSVSLAVQDSCPGYGGTTVASTVVGAVRHEWRIAPIITQGALDSCLRKGGGDCPTEKSYTANGTPETTFSFPDYRVIGGYQYKVELEIWDNCDRSAVDTIYFLSQPAANILTSDTTILGASVPFTVRGETTTGGALWRRIAPSPKVFSTLPNITDTLVWSMSLQNQYVYVLQDTAIGCTATDTVRIQLNNLADAGPDRYICKGGSDEPILGTGYNMDTTLYDYEWTPITGLTRSPNRYATRAKPDVSTLYTLKVKQKNTQNVLETDQVWVYVQDTIRSIILRHYASGDNTCFVIEEPDPLEKNFTYLWEYVKQDGTSGPLSDPEGDKCLKTSTHVAFSGYDTLEVCLTLTNACDTLKYCKTIEFFNQKAQGFRQENPEPVEVKEVAPLLMLYPNPTDGLLQAAVNLPDNTTTAELSLYNSLGIEVRRYRLPKPRSIMDINALDLPAGLYHCVLMADGIRLTSLKLIID